MLYDINFSFIYLLYEMKLGVRVMWNDPTQCSFVWMTLFVYICTDEFVATRLFFSADMHRFAGANLRDPFHLRLYAHIWVYYK